MNSPDVTPGSIIRFWFGDDPQKSASDTAYQQLWWSKQDAIDQQIRQRFEATVLLAAEGALRKWESTASGLLALIILTDQFPRNIYRGTAKSFEYDRLALAWCLTGIEEAKDQQVMPIQRLFWYLPLEHSESIAHQDKCVSLVERLVAEAPSDDKPAFRDFLNYAERHREVIRRFDRFPHRNAILGRESSAEEEIFLKAPGSSF
jgi:uncharacterized protein (DUF924 family)